MEAFALPPPYLRRAVAHSPSYLYIALGLMARMLHWLLTKVLPEAAAIKQTDGTDSQEVTASQAPTDGVLLHTEAPPPKLRRSSKLRTNYVDELALPTAAATAAKLAAPATFMTVPCASAACLPVDDVGGIAGVPARKAAVLVIDVQPIWSSSDPIVQNFPKLGKNVSALLAKARGAGMPVVHVRASYDDSPHVALLRRNAPHLNRTGCIDPHATEEWAEALPGEHIVYKPSFNGFHKTNLESLLKETLQVERVYLCGLVTSACVLSTALGAFSAGIDPIIVEDCVADRTRQRHEAALALWDHYVFRVCRSWRDVTTDFEAEVEAAHGAVEEEEASLSDTPRTGYDTPAILGGQQPRLKLDFDSSRISPSSTVIDLQSQEHNGRRYSRSPIPIPPPDHVGRTAIDCVARMPLQGLDGLEDLEEDSDEFDRFFHDRVSCR
jgi:nicotinamidase-related amidase